MPVVGVLLAHLVGDYILQSDWMANEKTKRWFPAWAHAITYGLPFLFITQSPAALAVIIVTHAVIDHYRLAKYVVWVKNFLAPRVWWHSWSECSETGYPRVRQPWLSVWLMIIVDNTMHLVINIAAVRYL